VFPLILLLSFSIRREKPRALSVPGWYKTAHKIVRTGKKVFFHEDLNLKGLTQRNKPKQDETGKFLPNGQSAKSGLNKSWLDAAFGNFFNTLEYIAAKAGSTVIPQKPAYSSMILCYRNEVIFTDTNIREYWDEELSLMVDRDINAAIAFPFESWTI
jgi:putative transposase